MTSTAAPAAVLVDGAYELAESSSNWMTGPGRLHVN
jgi:hypothetical protein